MIPVPHPDWFVQRGHPLNGGLEYCAIGWSILARSSAPRHAIAVELACGVTFFGRLCWLAARAVAARGRRFAIAATPNSRGGDGSKAAASSPSSLSFAANA